MKFPTSELANKWLLPIVNNGGRGYELGGSAHNTWGYDIMSHVTNVDFTDEFTVFKQAEVDLCGEYLPVDVVAYADRLPFEDNSYDFALHSHCIEHCANPVRAHREWWRVLRDGAIVFGHIPHRDALPTDVGRELTTLEHFIRDYEQDLDEDTHPIEEGCRVKGGHYHVWSVASYLDMIQFINSTGTVFDVVETQEVDEKAGNSHVIVLKVVK